MRYTSSLRSILAIAAFVICLSVAHAAGRIEGTVTDPTGAVVPNPQVTAINQATGAKYIT